MASKGIPVRRSSAYLSPAVRNPRVPRADCSARVGRPILNGKPSRLTGHFRPEITKSSRKAATTSRYLLGSGRWKFVSPLLNHVSRRNSVAQSQPDVLAPFCEPAAIACPPDNFSGTLWNLPAHFLGPVMQPTEEYMPISCYCISILSLLRTGYEYMQLVRLSPSHAGSSGVILPRKDT